MTGGIVLEKDDAVAIARLARPAALNALRQADVRRLGEILDELTSDDRIRVLVITGTGPAFCAGADLKELGREGAGRSEAGSRTRVEETQEITRRMVHHPKVIIAAVNGLAVGMGAELSVAADIRIAADTASFTFPEVKRALFETNGVTYLLPRLVGHGRALQWLLTGDTITAQEALAAGLVTRVTPAGRVLEAAVECARTIAANAPIPVGLVKQALRAAQETGLEEMLDREVEGVLECLRSEDFAEGVRAFLDKQPARYRGR